MTASVVTTGVVATWAPGGYWCVNFYDAETAVIPKGSWLRAGAKVQHPQWRPKIKVRRVYLIFFSVESLAEVNYFWHKLSADGDEESQWG
jgi:hypothetical protein